MLSMRLLYHIPAAFLPPRVKNQLTNLLLECFHRVGYAFENYDNVVLVQQDNCVIGLLCVREVVDDVDEEDQCKPICREMYVEKLCVLKRFRNLGIATEMLQYVSDELAKTQTQVLHVDKNDRHEIMCEFYKKRGFFPRYSNKKETCFEKKMAN